MGAIEIIAYILTVIIALLWAFVRFMRTNHGRLKVDGTHYFFSSSILPLIAAIAASIGVFMAPSGAKGYALFTLLGLGLLASLLEMRRMARPRSDGKSHLYGSFVGFAQKPKAYAQVFGILFLTVIGMLLIGWLWMTLTSPVLERLLQVDVNGDPAAIASQAGGMRSAILQLALYSIVAVAIGLWLFSFMQGLVWGIAYGSKQRVRKALMFSVSGLLLLSILSIPFMGLVYFASQTVTDASSASWVVIAMPVVIAIVAYLYACTAAAFQSKPSWLSHVLAGISKGIVALPKMANPIVSALFFLFVLDLLLRPFVDVELLLYPVAVVFILYAVWAIFLFAGYLQEVFPSAARPSQSVHGNPKKSKK